jgi:hypothetical protein
MPKLCPNWQAASYGTKPKLGSVFALWGRVPYYLLSGSPTNPPEKRVQMSKFTYTLNASFVTDRELSEEELNAIVSQVAPQIEEPVNAEYETKLIACEVGSLLIEETLKIDKRMAVCSICFEHYLTKNERDHQCPEFYDCGACGEGCEAEEGTIELIEGEIVFTHKAELCPAQDEIEGE